MPLGSRLRAVREQRQLTQDELAKLIGTHQNQIVRWENGQTLPGADSLIQLSKMLDVSVDYLLGLVDQPKAYLTEKDLSPQERRLLTAMDQRDLSAMLRVLLDVHEEEAAKDREREGIAAPSSTKQRGERGPLKGAKASNQG